MAPYFNYKHLVDILSVLNGISKAFMKLQENYSSSSIIHYYYKYQGNQRIQMIYKNNSDIWEIEA